MFTDVLLVRTLMTFITTLSIHKQTSTCRLNNVVTISLQRTYRPFWLGLRASANELQTVLYETNTNYKITEQLLPQIRKNRNLHGPNNTVQRPIFFLIWSRFTKVVILNFNSILYRTEKVLRK